ncbi:F-box domain [Ceraceosorus bombacis]|uniref:F-box domain n=1 Tax=Ceraceosorus bombacis TaxID=401625 RepID=A0A0P1BFX7_9BASI|nr:F-box domain [Ceraceosorus bombacis]
MANMQALRAELFRLVISSLDPKSVFRARRVCVSWKLAIDADDTIWRSIARCWNLEEDLVVLSASSGARARAVTQQNSGASCAQLLRSSVNESDTKSSFKLLCFAYVQRTLSWTTADDFIDAYQSLKSRKFANAKWWSEGVSSNKPAPGKPRARVHQNCPSHEFVVDTIGSSRTLRLYHKDSSTPLSSTGCLPEVWREFCLLVRPPTCVFKPQPRARGFPEYVGVWDTSSSKAPVVFDVVRKVDDLDFDADESLLFGHESGTNSPVIYSCSDGAVLSENLFENVWWLLHINAQPSIRQTPFDLAQTAGQVLIGTAYCSVQRNENREYERLQVDIRWESPQDEPNSRLHYFDSFRDFIKAPSAPGAYLNGIEPKVLEVHADHETATLVLSYSWGLALVRPYTCIKSPEHWSSLRVAFLDYYLVGQSAVSERRWNVRRSRNDYASGRVYQRLVERHEYGFFVDLDAHRLDPTWTPKHHLFENVNVWCSRRPARFPAAF